MNDDARSKPYKRRACSPFYLCLMAMGIWGLSGFSKVFAAGETVSFVAPTSSFATTYSTVSNNVLNFTVQASNGVLNPDTGFEDTVTVGLYDTVTGLPAEPQAVWVVGASTPVTAGTDLMTFTNGVLNFSVTVTAGSNSMDVSITDGNITSGNSYPGTIGTLTGPDYPGYQVRGFFQPYYPETASGTGVAAVYFPSPTPGVTDLLLTTPSLTAVNAPGQIAVTVANVNGITNSLCFAVTGINGGYAAAGAGVSVLLGLEKASNAFTAPVTYEVILDYGSAPSGPLTDYGNPRPAYDTVYMGSAPDVTRLLNNANGPENISSMSPVGGFASPQPFMTNGQIIFRVWTGAPAGDAVYLIWASGNGNDYSSLDVPYSPSNVQPLRSTITVPGSAANPATVLGGNPVTLVDTFLNNFNSSVTQIVLQVPPNSPASGTYWNFTSVNAGGNSAAINSNPSGSAPGTITLNCSANPIGLNQSFAVSLVGTASGQDGSWPISIIGCTTSLGTAAPTDFSKALADTLGVPNAVTGLTSQPVNFTGTGGQISLAWTQVSNENTAGYVLSRSPAGGSFTGNVTLPNGAVVNNAVTIQPATTVSYLDSSATNLTGYTYTISAYNQVVTSTSAATGPVTAYANPGPPTGVTALTGGTTVQLSWTAPVSVSGSYAVANYQIYEGTSSGGENAVPIVTTAASPYQVMGLTPGTQYYFKISAIDSQYASGPAGGAHDSVVSSEATGFPNGWPPTSLTASLSSPPPSPAITLNWTAPSAALELNPPLTNYVIYKATAPSTPNPNVPYATVSGSTLSYTDSTGLATGNSYNYQVAAVDNKGVTSNVSNQANQSVGPSPPTGLAAVPSSTGVTLTWTANPGSQGVTGYQIYQNSSLIANSAGASFLVPAATAVQGQNDAYYVEAVDANPVTSGASSTVNSALFPVAVTGMSVTTTAGNPVTISWATPVAGNANITGYNLYRNTTNVLAGTPIATPTIPAVTYTDPALSAGTTVFYFLEAQNIAGAGPPTLQAAQIPPNAPTTTIASTSNAATITVNWNANAAYEAVSYYTVYRTLLPAGTPTPIATVTSPAVTYNDVTGAQGVTYVYNITATNLGSGATIFGGESLKSNSITMGLEPPAPTGLAVTFIDTSNNISVTWTGVTIVDPNASSVSLLVNTSNSTAGAVAVNITPASTTSYVDTGVFDAAVTGEGSDTVYYYFLKTNNPYGSSVTSAAVSQLTYPAPVTLNTISSASNGISRILNWSILPLADVDVTQYNVYRQLQGASQFVSVGSFTATGLTMPVTLTNPIQPGEIYNYKITAVNATGEGGSATTVTYGTSPTAPAPVTAVSGISSASAQVNLSWPAVTGQNVVGYTVYRNPTTNTLPYAVTITLGNVTSYVDNGVVGGTAYYYLVEADSADGKESISNTTTAVAVTAFALPNVPTGLTETDGTGNAALTWVAPAVTTYPIAGYNLYDSPNGGATVKANATPVPIDTTLTGLTNGTPYNFFVQTVDSQGNLSALSPAVPGEPVAPPGAPVSVTASDGNTAVLVSWNSATTGTLPLGGYLVLESLQGSGVTTLATETAPNSTGYVVSSLTNGDTYLFWVVAVDNSGVTTGINASSVVGPVTGIPGLHVNPPNNVLAVGATAAVTVTWLDAVPAGAPVTGYVLYKNTAPSGAFSAIATIGSGVQTYTDSGVSVVNNTPYYYYFVSYSSGVASSDSATVIGIPEAPPPAPTPVAVLDGNNKESLSWTVSAVPAGPVTVFTYNIYRAIPPGSAPSLLGNSSGPGTVYADSTATNGIPAEYFVAAVNSNGTQGPNSAPVTGFPYTMTAPTGLTSSDSATAVTLTTWTPPATFSYPVTGYAVLKGSSPVTELPLTLVGAPPVTDAAVTLGQLYYYEVEAIDAKGHVGPPSAALADGPANPPGAPVTVLALPGDGQILVDWQAPVSAAGSLPVSQYIVTGTDGVNVLVPATQTYFLDSTTGNGTLVTYTVISVDSSGVTIGNHVSPGTNSLPVAGVAGVMNPPTGLTAIATGPKTVNLTWTVPNDKGLIVASYNVYRSGNFSGPFTNIANVPNPALAPVTAYSDTGVSADTTYYYVVQAVEASSPVTLSTYSNHALVTTPKPTTPVPPVTASVMAFDANVLKPGTGQVLGIYYVLPTTGYVELEIYNIAGYPIRYIHPGTASAGVQTEVIWDGKDRNGMTVASGIYLIEIRAPGFHQIKKVAVVK